MSWSCRIIKIIIILLSWQTFHSTGAIIYSFCWVLQGLFDLLLLFLAHEWLHLLLLLLRLLRIVCRSWIRWTKSWHTPLVPFLLHFLILIQEFFLQVIVLLLIFWRLIISCQDIAANSLKRAFHLELRLLLLQLLELLLEYLVVLLLLFKPSNRVHRLI